MRIALVTYHFGYNEGTMLQAYASLKLLQRKFPTAQVEILDWRYGPKEDLAFPAPKTGRECAIRQFFDERLILSKPMIRGSGPGEAYRFLHENYSLVVIGSDEVWRLGYASKFPFGLFGEQVKNPWVPPFPNVYWPAPEEFRVPCASLSSSVADNDSVRDIPWVDRKLMKDALLRIRPMSVRDERSAGFIKRILHGDHPDCRWMPDPTFSLRIEDFYASESAGQRVAKIRAEAGRMIALLVSVRNDLKTLEIIKALKISGYTTVSLSSSHSEADFDLADQAIDPIEWASLLGSVDLVITERFHGAVFAIRGNTPVIALGYRNQRSLAPSKLLDLFARFDISNYFFDMSTWSPAVLKRFEKLLDISIWPNKLVNDRASNFSSKLEVFGSELAKLFGPNSAL
jgi:hypothetical protein